MKITITLRPGELEALQARAIAYQGYIPRKPGHLLRAALDSPFFPPPTQGPPPDRFAPVPPKREIDGEIFFFDGDEPKLPAYFHTHIPADKALAVLGRVVSVDGATVEHRFATWKWSGVKRDGRTVRELSLRDDGGKPGIFPVTVVREDS